MAISLEKLSCHLFVVLIPQLKDDGLVGTSLLSLVTRQFSLSKPWTKCLYVSLVMPPDMV